MDSESQIALQMARVEAGLKELEHTVENFEQAVARAEQCFGEEEAVRDEASLRPLTGALQVSQNAAVLVRAANTSLDEALLQAETTISIGMPREYAMPFLPGTLICDGRYRLVQLIHSRPRVNLYLARRLPATTERATSARPLVAVREIVLSGLAPSVRQSVVRAAFEEFAAPQFLGSAHLPGVGDHVYLEDDRHYLIMQPRQVRGTSMAGAQPLSERLPGVTRLDMSTALHLGTRLCQTVTRLHRLNLYLGEIPPTLLLIDHLENAYWAPLLLVAWPPAPHFWPGHSRQAAQRLSEQIFPSLEPDLKPFEQDNHPFAAPEVFHGQRDARSDVYALGTLLYLLYTGTLPPAASQRQRVLEALPQPRSERPRQFRRPQPVPPPSSHLHQDPTLTAPHFLNPEISPLLEQIFLRALALQPEQRFASARDLAEALESMHLKTDQLEMPVLAPPFPRAKTSRLRRLLEWLRR